MHLPWKIFFALTLFVFKAEIVGHKLKVDDARRKFFIDGAEIFLRNKEFDLLIYFLKNSGKIITRTQLLEDVWDTNIFCMTNTVDVHISNLRQKLRPHFKSNLIKTIHCVGYIFDI